jgi:hypothetical protein
MNEFVMGYALDFLVIYCMWYKSDFVQILLLSTYILWYISCTLHVYFFL